MTDLTLLHTAQVHRATFDALAARIAPGARLCHVVRPDWLTRAQNGIGADLADEIRETITAAPGPVLCSCTTLGPVAGAAGAVRIDAPMMAQAAQTGGPVLLAYCLDSTRVASRDLLAEALDAGTKFRLLDLTELWPLFERGEGERFARAIAGRVAAALADAPDTGCVVLAQASMAGAAAHITAHVPVLSSPETALRAALGLPRA
ncbi:hypothetical protein [Aquicoccus sp. SU-CL01552]|uniref:hypothetical protein n=1 Tax=Aquicoccus sp. SU-CL01552 TaxID=3127656 RepID=UPI0031087009